jgi:hypothetical protein
MYRGGDKQYFDANPERLLALEPCVRFVAHMWADRVLSDMAVIDKINKENAGSATLTFYEDMITNCEEERARISSFNNKNYNSKRRGERKKGEIKMNNKKTKTKTKTEKKTSLNRNNYLSISNYLNPHKNQT